MTCQLPIRYESLYKDGNVNMMIEPCVLIKILPNEENVKGRVESKISKQ